LLALSACWRDAPPPSTTLPAPDVSPPAVTRKMCDRLWLHLVDLEFQRIGRGDPATNIGLPTDDVEKLVPVCLELPYARLQCALAATTMNDVAKCDGPRARVSSRQ
jgi:hypothetical protein